MAPIPDILAIPELRAATNSGELIFRFQLTSFLLYLNLFFDIFYSLPEVSIAIVKNLKTQMKGVFAKDGELRKRRNKMDLYGRNFRNCANLLSHA